MIFLNRQFPSNKTFPSLFPLFLFLLFFGLSVPFPLSAHDVQEFHESENFENFEDSYNTVYTTHEGLSLDLTRPGFVAMSKAVENHLLKGMESKKIPDMETSIPLVMHSKVEGLAYSVEFENLSLTPTHGGIAIQVQLKNLHVKANHIRFENYLAPWIGTSCHNTNFFIAHRRPILLKAHLKASMTGNKILFNLQEFSLPVLYQNYQVVGPAACHGPFGIPDYFTQFVGREILQQAAPFIEVGLKYKIKELLPKLEQYISSFAQVKIPFKTPSILLFPETNLLLGFAPYKLSLTPEKMSLHLSLMVGENQEKSLTTSAVSPNPTSPLYGTLGINPQFINSILELMLPEGSEPFEINEHFNQNISMLLSKKELISFWPDLEKLKTDTDKIRLFGRLAHTPELRVQSLENLQTNLVLNFPDITLTFQVQQNEQWFNYHTIHLGVEAFIKTQLDQGVMNLKLSSVNLQVKGEWDSQYTPEDPTFHHETAHLIFNMLMQGYVENGEALTFSLPEILLGDKELTLSRMRLEKPFLKMDVVDALPNGRRGGSILFPPTNR